MYLRVCLQVVQNTVVGDRLFWLGRRLDLARYGRLLGEFGRQAVARPLLVSN